MHAVFEKLARLMALLGGLVLAALIVLTCLSIFGRMINTVLHSDVVQSISPGLAEILLATGVGPINGDFELVEAGMAFAIFAFLPLCQLHGAHAAVDIFTSKFPTRVNHWLKAVIEIVFALVLILIAVQLFSGLQSKLRSGQTTFLLEFPIWWAYAVSVAGAAVAALIGVYVAALRLFEALTGRKVLPPEMGAEH